jgi:hypothetical protein
MAKALECPACGAKHRLHDLGSTPTFRCDRCGQTLKVPASVIAERADASASTAGSGAAPVMTPPQRRAGGAPGATEVIGASGALAPAAGGDAPSSPIEPQPGATARPRVRRVHWYWRLLAWVVALPVGFVVTGLPAYEFKLIRKDDVLNLFVGSGSGRYTRLVIVTLIWAVVTAVLVQCLIEGGRWWSARRRARRDRAARRGAGTVGTVGRRS